jgi:hypothetical protein
MINTIFNAANLSDKMWVKWLSIIGLCMQFFAFWLAAPELLGVDALKRFENGLVKLLSRLPGFTIGFIGFATGVGLGIYGMLVGLEGDADAVKEAFIWIGVVFGLYIVFIIFFYKRLQFYLKNKVAEPLMQTLIANNQARKTALVAGAILFTVGFLSQLIALILS